MYWDLIDSTFQPDSLLIQTSIMYKISWKKFSNLNLWFITVFVSNGNKLEQIQFFHWACIFLKKTFTLIWYLKPFVSFKRLLNKSLILDLLASNCTIGSFLSIISILYEIAYPLNAWSVFITLYTLQTGQYYKWRILIIEHINFSATTFLTLKLIFIWSWFETVYTHSFIISAKPPSINFR